MVKLKLEIDVTLTQQSCATLWHDMYAAGIKEFKGTDSTVGALEW